MPSGGHGGGGGSHFGGGGRGGLSGGGGNGGFRRNVPMAFWFFGRRYYLPLAVSNAVRTLLALTFIGVWTFFIFFASLKEDKGKINTIIYNRNRYISMIEFAKEEPSFRAEGTITAVKYNADAQKYYLLYRIPYSGSYGYLEGFTYSVYSSEDIKSFHVGQTLTFAVDEPTIFPNTDSINFGYENIPLSADGEYANLKKDVVYTSILCSVLGAATLAVFGVAVYKIVKNAKEKQEAKECALSETDFTGEKVIRCAYCGSVLPNGRGTCPNCGAKAQPEDKK